MISFALSLLTTVSQQAPRSPSSVLANPISMMMYTSALLLLFADSAFSFTARCCVSPALAAKHHKSGLRMEVTDEDSDRLRRDALRLPANVPDDNSDDYPSSLSPSEPDRFVPILAVGSFAGFLAIIANEYLTRGFCPPFLNTCLNVQQQGGWGS